MSPGVVTAAAAEVVKTATAAMAIRLTGNRRMGDMVYPGNLYAGCRLTPAIVTVRRLHDNTGVDAPLREEGRSEPDSGSVQQGHDVVDAPPRECHAGPTVAVAVHYRPARNDFPLHPDRRPGRSEADRPRQHLSVGQRGHQCPCAGQNLGFYCRVR